MPKRFKTAPANAFNGKKITVADTDRVDEHQVIAASFMSEVFDLLPGDYAVSDESELRDFTTFGIRDTSREWKTIEERYGLTRHDMGTENLATIFDQIAANRTAQCSK